MADAPRDQANIQGNLVHVQDLTAQTGYVSTQEFGGPGLKDVVKVFNHAALVHLDQARRALDPADDSVGAEHVTLPQGVTITHEDPEAAKARVLETADAVEKEVAAVAKAEEKAAASSSQGSTPSSQSK